MASTNKSVCNGVLAPNKYVQNVKNVQDVFDSLVETSRTYNLDLLKTHTNAFLEARYRGAPVKRPKI